MLGTSQGLKTAVKLAGTLNQPGDKDKSWFVEIAMPWEILKEAAAAKSAPHAGRPVAGQFLPRRIPLDVKNGAYVKPGPTPGQASARGQLGLVAHGLVNIHYPEMWGYVQFSGKIAGQGRDAFVKSPAEAAKWALRKIYYAEWASQADKGGFSADFAALGVNAKDLRVKGFVFPPSIQIAGGMFEAAFRAETGETWRIRRRRPGLERKVGGRSMPFDFDRITDRKGTWSLKWDRAERAFGLSDVIPMWVADMDFPSPPAVVEALTRRAGHGDLRLSHDAAFLQPDGHPLAGDRFGWAIERDWLMKAPGVVPSLNFCVRALTKPGEGSSSRPPSISPFSAPSSSTAAGSSGIPWPSARAVSRWTSTTSSARSTPETRMIILCSPHNPVGRVWTRAELERLGASARERDLFVVSDEIHADLDYSGHKHIPTAAVIDDLAGRTITLLAPSKTFNVAGLTTSLIVAKEAGSARGSPPSSAPPASRSETSSASSPSRPPMPGEGSGWTSSWSISTATPSSSNGSPPNACGRFRSSGRKGLTSAFSTAGASASLPKSSTISS